MFLFIEGDQENIVIGRKYFWTNENVFLSPFNKQKQRFGELEFDYFGGSDVVNKLQETIPILRQQKSLQFVPQALFGKSHSPS